MIRATFDSMCPGCGNVIEEGDEIGRLDGEWCCEVCVEDAGGEDERE